MQAGQRGTARQERIVLVTTTSRPLPLTSTQPCLITPRMPRSPITILCLLRTNPINNNHVGPRSHCLPTRALTHKPHSSPTAHSQTSSSADEHQASSVILYQDSIDSGLRSRSIHRYCYSQDYTPSSVTASALFLRCHHFFFLGSSSVFSSLTLFSRTIARKAASVDALVVSDRRACAASLSEFGDDWVGVGSG